MEGRVNRQHRLVARINDAHALVCRQWEPSKCLSERRNVTAVPGKKSRILNISHRILQRRPWHPTPVLLPGKSHKRRSLVGCSPWGPKSWTRLSDFTFTFHFHALEKEVVTHSSVLAWRIPGTGDPGGLPSMGSHRVGHD